MSSTKPSSSASGAAAADGQGAAQENAGQARLSGNKRSTQLRWTEYESLHSRLEFLESLLLRETKSTKSETEAAGRSFIQRPITGRPSRTSFQSRLNPQNAPPDLRITTPQGLAQWYLAEQKKLWDFAGTEAEPSTLDEGQAGHREGSLATVTARLPNQVGGDMLCKKRKPEPETANISEAASDEAEYHKSDTPPSHPPELIHRAVSLYIRYIHPHLPVLHARHFMHDLREEMEARSQDDSTHQPTAGSSRNVSPRRRKFDLVLQAIVSCVVRFKMVPSDDPAILALGGPDRLVLRAHNIVLLETWADPSLEALQALIMLAFTAVLKDWPDLRGWNLVGAAARLSVLIGLNREHAIDESQTSTFRRVTLSSQFLPKPIDPVDAELRRRIFWSIFLIDRLGGSTTGWTHSINRRDHGVDLPGHDHWDAIDVSLKAMSSASGDGGTDDRTNPRGRKPRIRSSFRFPPTERTMTELEAPNPQFRWTGNDDDDDFIDDRTPQSLLMEAAEGLGHVQVYLRQDFKSSTAGSRLAALSELDLRLERWYEQIPSQYRPRREQSSNQDLLSPSVNMMLAVHHMAVVLLHQVVAYDPPRIASWNYPNAVRRCQEAYTAMKIVLDGISPGYFSVQHPMFGHCVFVLGRALCMHLLRYKLVPTSQRREVAEANGQELLQCISVLEELGTIWPCGSVFAETLRRGYSAIDNPAHYPLFFDPRAVPLAAAAVNRRLWISSS